jgi:hypothetical protein
MNSRSRLILLAAAALWFSPLDSKAAEQGWFGFALVIDADGIFSPKLRSMLTAPTREGFQRTAEYYSPPRATSLMLRSRSIRSAALI